MSKKRDNRWCYSPMPHEEGWLELTSELLQRRGQDIIFEIVQLGQEAFKTKHNLRALLKGQAREKKVSTSA